MAKAVDSVRRQLLDVGKRNKLINAPIGKERAKQITIEDELSDEVFRILYLQGKSMTFQPAQDDISEGSIDVGDESVFLPTADIGPVAMVAAPAQRQKAPDPAHGRPPPETAAYVVPGRPDARGGAGDQRYVPGLGFSPVV